jgi:hypothetical protein
MFAPLLLQFGYEALFVGCNSFFYFSPRVWAVFVLDADNLMDEFVEFLLVLLRNFYACFLEDGLQMPEITGQSGSRSSGQ